MASNKYKKSAKKESSYAEGGYVDRKEQLLAHNGKVVTIDKLKYKIKAQQYEAIYPYKHQVTKIWFEPVNRTSNHYKDIKLKLGDDWLLEYDGISDDDQIEVLKQLGVFKKGGEIGRYTKTPEPAFEDGETVWAMLGGHAVQGKVVEHISSATTGGEYRHDYLVNLGAGRVERFMQSAIASTKEELLEQYHQPMFEKGGILDNLTAQQKDAIEDYLPNKIGRVNNGNVWAREFHDHDLFDTKTPRTTDYYGEIAKLISPNAKFLDTDSFWEDFTYQADELGAPIKYAKGGQTAGISSRLIGSRKNTVDSTSSKNLKFHVHEYDKDNNPEQCIVIVQYAEYPESYVEEVFGNYDGAVADAEWRAGKMKAGGTVAGASPKFKKVMHEFKEGELTDRWGNKVTSYPQAVAIAYSEARAAGEKMESGGKVHNYKDDITAKAVKFLQDKGYTIDAYSEVNRDSAFEIDDEELVMVQGSKGNGKIDIGIAYFISEFEEPISKKMLRHILSEFPSDKYSVTLYTNAGVEVRSNEMKYGKFEGLRIVKVSSDDIMEKGGSTDNPLKTMVNLSAGNYGKGTKEYEALMYYREHDPYKITSQGKIISYHIDNDVWSVKDNKMESGGTIANSISVAEFEKIIKDAFKVKDKWFFYEGVVNNEPVYLKMFVGKKEIDVQRFMKNGIHQRMPRNYSNQKDTLAMIMANFEDNKMESGGAVMSSVKKDVWQSYYKKKGSNEWIKHEILAGDISKAKALSSAKQQFIYDHSELKYPKQVNELYDWKVEKTTWDAPVRRQLKKGGKVNKYKKTKA